MENIDTIDTLLKAYLDGDRSDRTVCAINDWISSSPKNLQILIELEGLIAAKKMQDKCSPEQIEKVYKKVISENTGNKTAFKKNPWKYQAFFRYIAGIAAAIIIGAGTFFIMNRNINEKMLVAHSGDEIKVINLSDGSVVWLNKNSELQYPKAFRGNVRKVLLTGEAYFEVSANKDFPFVVSSSCMDVTAVGTAFNFSTRISADMEEAALLDGSVYVEGKNNEGKVMIVPYQKVILDKKTHRMTVEQMHTGIETYWHNHMAPLKNATMRDIARVFESIYNVSIKLIDENNYKSTYSGFISQDESIEEALEALSYSIPLTYSITGTNVTIRLKK